MVTTVDLLVFTTIVEQGSFSRAATKLHLAQPSISEKVARLERTVGAELFVRTNRGAELTAAGRRLLPDAQRCLALCEEGVRAVRSNDAEATFRVLMHSSYAPTIMPLLLDALAAFPLEISNNDADSEHVVQAVADGTADAGFSIAVPHPHTVRLEPFYADPVVCVAAPDHELARQPELHVKDLAQHLVAVNVWGDGAEGFMELLRAEPIAATRLRPVSPAETAATLARLRSHVAVCTRSTVTLDLAQGRLVELPVVDLPRWVVELYLVRRVADEGSAPIEALRKTVEAHPDGPASWLLRVDPPAPVGPDPET